MVSTPEPPNLAVLITEVEADHGPDAAGVFVEILNMAINTGNVIAAQYPDDGTGVRQLVAFGLAAAMLHAARAPRTCDALACS